MASGPDKKDDDDGLSQQARAVQQAAPYMAAVWKLISGTLLGVAGGYFLSKHWGKPWLMVLGAVFGIGAGFYGFIADLIRLGKKK